MSDVAIFLKRYRSRPRFAELLSACHDLLKTVRHPYRPERHYMRGPGPKWLAKHAEHADG
ncbi:MAG TPA: hypothetical protein VFB45_10050 [Pseudolabrys sp.]|nr:hypothetical protein [Pseudolabrys sp.]